MPIDVGGPEVLSEVARRAWAVEQAVSACATMQAAGMKMAPHSEDLPSIIGLSDRFLAYLETPFRQADAKLLEAARAYDGTQAAGPLVGMLADALERMVRGG